MISSVVAHLPDLLLVAPVPHGAELPSADDVRALARAADAAARTELLSAEVAVAQVRATSALASTVAWSAASICLGLLALALTLRRGTGARPPAPARRRPALVGPRE